MTGEHTRDNPESEARTRGEIGPARLTSRFPFLNHRTLAEVAETERLATLISGSEFNGLRGVPRNLHRRLTQLLAKVPDAEIYPLSPRSTGPEAA